MRGLIALHALTRRFGRRVRHDYRGGRGGVGGLSGAWYSQKFSAARQTPPFRSHSAATLVGGDAAGLLYEADEQPLTDAMIPMTANGTKR